MKEKSVGVKSIVKQRKKRRKIGKCAKKTNKVVNQYECPVVI